MSQTYYEIYRAEVLALTRSIVIKNNFTAMVINAGLKEFNWAVNEEDPTTWKYYLNLAGIYHKSDTVMQVRSLDTREIIDFTQENLKIHRATAREYKPGSVYYRTLANKYDTQVDLINGIIFPVDMAKAINSQDGDILYYDSQYVEGNEDTFLSDLQSWVKVFLTTRFNEQFMLIDDMYLQNVLGQMAAAMPYAIELIRIRNCHTNRVHSFHIREYLASNGQLDGYIPYLSKEQQLFLYRNIRHIRLNVGKEKTFKRLIDRLLTRRGIPLIDYTLDQNASKMPGELYPSVELVKHDINSQIVAPGNNKVTVEQMLTRENPLARDNALIQYDAEQEIISQVKSDRFSTMPTKILDSEVVDRGNSNIKQLTQVLFNQWIHLSSTNRYRAYINIVNPSDGEVLSLSAKDALIVSLYAYCRTRGLEYDTVPKVIAYEVLRSPLPNYKELESISDPKYIWPGMIQYVMDHITPMTEYISTEAFYNDCHQQHQEYLALWETYSFQEHYRSRLAVEQLVKRHYMHIKCPLVDEVISYEKYFDDIGIEVATMSNADLDSLLNVLINTATGANLITVITLGEIQAQLLKLMGQLTSYPLQYLRNLSSTDYRILGIPAIRLGDVSVKTVAHDWINALNVNVINYKAHVQSSVELPFNKVVPNVSVTAATKSHTRFDPTVQVRERFNPYGRYRLNVLGVGVRGIKFSSSQNPNTGELTEYDPL